MDSLFDSDVALDSLVELLAIELDSAALVDSDVLSDSEVDSLFDSDKDSELDLLSDSEVDSLFDSDEDSELDSLFESSGAVGSSGFTSSMFLKLLIKILTILESPSVDPSIIIYA